MKDVYTGTGPNKKCDLCPDSEKHDAEYDAPTALGPWANLCADHFATDAHPSANLVGFRLLWGEAPERTDDSIRADLNAAIEAGDFAAFEDALGDRDFAEFF